MRSEIHAFVSTPAVKFNFEQGGFPFATLEFHFPSQFATLGIETAGGVVGVAPVLSGIPVGWSTNHFSRWARRMKLR